MGLKELLKQKEDCKRRLAVISASLEELTRLQSEKVQLEKTLSNDDDIKQAISQVLVRKTTDLDSRVKQITDEISILESALESAKSAYDSFDYSKASELLGYSQMQQPKEFVFVKSNVPYAKGMHNLRLSIAELEREHSGSSLHPLVEIAGERVPRPLTTQENVRYMLEDWNTEKSLDGTQRTEQERARLFIKSWKDSCDGVANKAKTTKFKIIPECSQLLALPEDFNKEFVVVNYKKDFSGFEELDSSEGKYNQDLNETEFNAHPGWAQLIPDTDLKKDFGTAVYYLLDKFRNGRKIGAGFYVLQNTAKDELRAAFLHLLSVDCDADAGGSLNYNSSFLRVGSGAEKSP